MTVRIYVRRSAANAWANARASSEIEVESDRRARQIENIRRTTDRRLAFVAGRLRAIKRLKSAPIESVVDIESQPKLTKKKGARANAGKEAGLLRKRERTSVTGEKKRAKRKKSGMKRRGK